ncbi:MAG TPA: VOC family protein [Acidimicrobiales bacterium]|jgi:catechol-2,3-dioxygenase|nr:VOC family protein [Acidimicrobiales bacterium]
MAIRRLNHAVLYVRDVDRSVAFYRDALDFEVITEFPGAAFLRASGSTNDHDLGLFEIGATAADSGAGTTSVGLYHLAWEVETLAELVELRARLEQHGALVGASDHGTTKSLYAKDPDGLEFEVCWIIPKDRLDGAGMAGVQPLDLDKEIARFGAETVGGLGISWPEG